VHCALIFISGENMFTFKYVLCVTLIAGLIACNKPSQNIFDTKKDLLSLHYDHAPDKDDGQSAAADRTILETMFGIEWIKNHVIAVSGTYGKNAPDFDVNSDLVMDAVWNDTGAWLKAHTHHHQVVSDLAALWSGTIKGGGRVWVKEGGQSDLTSDVVKIIKKQYPEIDTARWIHVVQHSNWNEDQTTDDALSYVKKYTHYIRIRDANAYLNIKGGDEKFVDSAVNHPLFGGKWRAAFVYYDPKERLDFSDSGELMHILGLGEIDIENFRNRFLD